MRASLRPGETWTAEGARPRLVTGWALRAVVAVLALAAVLVVVVAAGGGGLRLLGMAVLVGVVVGMLASPTSPLATVFVLVAALVVLDAPAAPWLALPVGALLHAVHVGVAWCAVVPPEAEVELAALRPTLVRWLLTQALCLPVALVVVLAAGAAPAPGTWSGLADVGAGVVLLAAGLQLARLVRRGTDQPADRP